MDSEQNQRKRCCIAVSEYSEIPEYEHIKAHIKVQKKDKIKVNIIKDIYNKTIIQVKKVLKKVKECTSVKLSNLKIKTENLWGDINKKLSYASVGVVIIILFTILFSAFYAPGYEVYLKGKSVGVVSNRGPLAQIISESNAKIQRISGKPGDIDSVPTYLFRLARKTSFTTNEQLSNNIIGLSSNVVSAYVINVDGNEVATVLNQGNSEKVLEEIKKGYKINEDALVEIISNISIVNKYTNLSQISNMDRAIGLLKETKSVLTDYIVTKSDSLWGIARANGTTIDAILEMNASMGQTIKEGDKIKVPAQQPILVVKTISKESLEESIPFLTTKIEDSSMYQGKSEVAQKGAEGKQKIDAQITRVSSIEVDRNVLAVAVVAEPVNEVVKVGTKVVPSGIGTGSFTTPYYGTITSRFGPRWGSRHTGLDIAGKIGDPVKAADDGKVVFADRSGDYGLLVKIDHNNGYQTWYGHLSKIGVNVGDIVTKNDEIGKLGTTGRSTGPHVHFEVRKDGVPQNPQSFIK